MFSKTTITLSLLLCAFFCITLASNEQIIKSDTDWELTANNNGGSLRATSLRRFFNGLWYSSLEINKDKSSGDLNYISGASAAPLVGSLIASFPAATLGFFGAQVSVEEPTQDDPWKLQVDVAAGFMATSFFKIEEIDPSGNVVDTFLLNRNNYKLSDVGEKGPLRWATYTAKIKKTLIDLNPHGDLAITFLITDQAGKVNFNTNVNPTSLESIIQISGFKYEDAANHLRLSMGVATGDASWDKELGFVTQNVQTNAVFFRIANVAEYSADTKPVTVSVFKKAEFDAAFGPNLKLKAHMTSKFGGNWETRIVEVDFAPGADLITYDPTLGAGVQESDTSAASSLPLFKVLCFALVMLAFLL